MRIVQLNTCDQSGGAATVARDLHAAFRRRGHWCRLVVGEKKTADPDVLELDNSGRRRGRWLGRALAEKFLGWEAFSYPGAHALRRLVGSDWDVLLAHNLHGGYFDLGALPGLSRLAPTALMLHDTWLLSGHCGYFLACRRWEQECGACPDLTLPPALPRDATRFNRRRKQRLLAAATVSLTAPSQWLLDEVGRSHLAARPRRLIRNGVDREIFRPGDRAAARRELALPADRPLVFFCAHGALGNPYKGGEVLLAALRRLVKELPQVLLVSLGSPLPPAAADLAEAIRTYPYESDPRRLARYYQAADAFVLASRAENAPLVLLEAQACGLPAVASRVGGIPEYLGEAGLLADPDAPADFAAALARLLTDRDLAARCAAAARQAGDGFSLERQADELLAWFGELGAKS